MDTGYVYMSRSVHRVTIYAPAGVEPPERITLTITSGANAGREVVFARLSDRELTCGAVDGVKGACESWDCHRARLGECQCGRHRGVLDPDDDPRPPIRLRPLVAQ